MICVSCFNEIKTNSMRRLIENDYGLCDECISQIKTKLSIKKIDGCFILFLGEYDGIMKKWLMNYKEYGDIALARCFLYVYIPLLKVLFPNYIFVPCPSSPSRNSKRGFIHLEEMLKVYDLKYCLALKKENDDERKKLNAIGRANDKNDISLTDKSKILVGKKVLLFDDVLTSGFTFRTSLETIRKCQPKKVKGLILMNAFKC